ncbi:protein angel isoform X2 [Orussus abietinus]|uniref:protein angel isoform X2 n=1 Tax=Orussus abietinus TaxID=222816 RepID=UPI000625BFD5|nr:protein angel isoform X2 [Orussus abietinus]
MPAARHCRRPTFDRSESSVQLRRARQPWLFLIHSIDDLFRPRSAQVGAQLEVAIRRHRLVAILHMTEVPLKHLLLRHLSKAPSIPEALFSTYLHLLETAASPVMHQEFNRTIMEPFFESCIVPTDAPPVCERTAGIQMNVNRELTSVSSELDACVESECSALENRYLKAREKYKAMRWWKSLKKGKSKVNSDDSFVIRLLSFNILAQYLLERYPFLYKQHDKRALPWDVRKPLLLQEIIEADANVICLQEMQEDHLKDFLTPFEELGYKYIYKKRTNDKMDGLLLLYRGDQFDVVEYAKVEMFQSDNELLSRDNVGLVVKLAVKESPNTQIVIATTHLLYNPRRDDVRLCQTQLLFSEIERIAFIENTVTGPKYHPILLAGDFNLEPNTGVYRFITEGYFEYEGKSRTLEEADHHRLSNYLMPPRLHITDNCQHLNILTKRLFESKNTGKVMLENSEGRAEEVNSLVERFAHGEFDSKSLIHQRVEILNGYYVNFSSGCLTHPFKMQSLYKHVTEDGKREATTNQGRWITVDYIFFTEVEPLEKYVLPTVAECSTFPTIPNFVVGSDHLSLGGSFKLQRKG